MKKQFRDDERRNQNTLSMKMAIWSCGGVYEHEFRQSTQYKDKKDIRERKRRKDRKQIEYKRTITDNNNSGACLE